MSQPEDFGEVETKTRKRGRKPKMSDDQINEQNSGASADSGPELSNSAEAATVPLVTPSVAAPPPSATIPPAYPTAAAPTYAEPALPPPANYVTQELATIPEEPPLYLRNPGPPPKMPRNSELHGVGRNSYRFREIRGVADYKTLLIACAVIGVLLLGFLLFWKPQNNAVVSLPSLPAAATVRPTAVPTVTPSGPVVMLPVAPAEQYALVVAPEGATIMEEPKESAAQMQVYARYTVLSLSRKTNQGWYEIKGSIGWLRARDLKFYPDIDSAWAAKRQIEGSSTPNG